MNTIDNLMALADNYATLTADTAAVTKAREALRTALTEALAALPVREPLSNEQMRNLSYLPECVDGDYLQVYPFARAIERAHGIGGEK